MQLIRLIFMDREGGRIKKRLITGELLVLFISIFSD